MRRMLIALAVGLLAVSALAGEPSVPVKGVAQPPTWVDAKGEVMGPYLDNGLVLLRLDQLSIATALADYQMDPQQSYITWEKEQPLLFAEPGCTGTAYSYYSNFFGANSSIVTEGPGEGQFTLHVIGTRGEVVTVYSVLWVGTCTERLPEEQTVWPVIKTYNLSKLFQPPFRVR